MNFPKIAIISVILLEIERELLAILGCFRISGSGVTNRGLHLLW